MMKYKLLILILLTTWSMFSYSQLFNKNPHRFDVNNWSITESCNPCHMYLDNSGIASVDSFQMYYESDSAELSAKGYVSGISKMCYSCHDGTIASNSHNDGADPTISEENNKMTLYHPISVRYVYSDTGKTKLNDPYLTLSELGGSIAEDMLSNGNVECTSCHDAHFSNQNVACQICPPGGNKNDDLSYFSLLKSNRFSQLCLTCHKL